MPIVEIVSLSEILDMSPNNVYPGPPCRHKVVGGSGLILGVFFLVLRYIIVLTKTNTTLFTELKKLAVVSSSVRRRFQKYRGIHTIREFKSRIAKKHILLNFLAQNSFLSPKFG